MKRVGYWISDKKGKKLNFDGFVSYCWKTGLELIKIDLNSDLDSQGPFDVIIHKLTDVIAKAETNHELEKKQIKLIQEYCTNNPNVKVLDPIIHVQQLLDRYRQYCRVLQCPIVAKGNVYKIPTFVELTSNDVQVNLDLMKKADVTFPFVCKPLLAHGIKTAHQMALVFNKSGLADIQTPCVIQTFINHDALMYKIFVVGKNYSIVERPSLKNFVAADQETIFFDSHDISKANASCSLVKLDEDCTPNARPADSIFFTLAEELQKTFQLNLFGIDVIVDKSDGSIAIIDINSFPGYDGVDNVFPSMVQLIYSVIGDGCSEKEANGVNARKIQDNNNTSKSSKPDTINTIGNADGNVDGIVGGNGSEGQSNAKSNDKSKCVVVEGELCSDKIMATNGGQDGRPNTNDRNLGLNGCTDCISICKNNKDGIKSMNGSIKEMAAVHSN